MASGRGRGFLTAAAFVTAVATLAACGGTSGPRAGGGGNGAVVVWTTTASDSVSAVFKKSVTSYEAANKGAKVTLTQYDPNSLKTKTQVALGAKQGPDIFYGYGGGILKSYVDAGDVAPLDSLIPNLKSLYLPSVLQNVTFNGHIYGIPMRGTEPVVFYYNKSLFTKAGINTAPATWTELLADIAKLKAAGVIPISLAGQDQWPYLMYLEYLVDRVGGAQAFNKVLSGDANAWNDPAFVTAERMIQDLVKAGAFGNQYAATSYTTGQSSALIYTGKSAMQLMGSWSYGDYTGKAPEFVKGGDLGYFAFPSVDGGAGDPHDIAGNVSEYYSINNASTDKPAAAKYLQQSVGSTTYSDGLASAGDLPATPTAGATLNAQNAPAFTKWLYTLVSKAPNYQMSWDQALPPATATALLPNLSQLFLLKSTPEEFSAAMAAAK